MIIDEAAYLKHYGVKGMKWGVINKDDTSSSSSNAKDSNAEHVKIAKSNSSQKPSKKEQSKNLADNKQKFLNKLGGDSSKKEVPPTSGEKGWRPTGKQVATVAVGAAFVGVLAYGAYSNHKFVKGLTPNAEISAGDFQKAVHMSQLKTWTKLNNKGFLDETSFLQEEFTLPQGHIFHRITTQPQKTLGKHTYSVTDMKDFNRYVAGFRGEKIGESTFHHVTFRAKSEVKIPSLHKAIDIMRETLTKEQYGLEATVEEAMTAFTTRSGGDWSDSTSRSFIRRLTSQGYGGIVDHMDAGVIGDRPLVIFNRQLFHTVRSSRMSASDIATAESSLLELAARQI